MERRGLAFCACYPAAPGAALFRQRAANAIVPTPAWERSNGGGSDHAWGNHQLVLGGAVQGGIYGQFPEFALGGPDDANDRGVWIPKISTAQFGATLGHWFGASDAELATVFPNLKNFPVFPIA